MSDIILGVRSRMKLNGRNYRLALGALAAGTLVACVGMALTSAYW